MKPFARLSRRAGACLLALLSAVCLSFAPLTAQGAAGDSAASDSSAAPATGGTLPPKEEVVYANLLPGGEAREVRVVNSFRAQTPTEWRLTDYGAYSAVRNMTTTDELKLENGCVTADVTAQSLYYEGLLPDAQLPWTVSLRYTLDGKECAPADLAGQRGALEISGTVTRNDACAGSFFDRYALQVVLTLDTSRCADIEAPGATVASVGANRQVTFTLLPGAPHDFTVRAQVEDFQMDGVSLNGIPLSLDLSFDDSALREQAGRLQSAAVQLDDGADTLRDGSGTLSDGTGALSTGAAALDSGVKQLRDGLDALQAQSPDLKNGSAQILAALRTLADTLDGAIPSADELQTLLSAYKEIQQGTDALADGISQLQSGFSRYQAFLSFFRLDLDTLQRDGATAIKGLKAAETALGDQIKEKQAAGEDTTQLSEHLALLESVENLLTNDGTVLTATQSLLTEAPAGITQLVDGAKKLQAGESAFGEALGMLADRLADLLAQLARLSDAIDQLAAQYETLDNGVGAYTDGVAQIVSAYGTLVSGARQLADSADVLDDGAKELHAGLSDLADGTGVLRGETSGIDGKISEQIDAVLDGFTGKGDPVSFVDPQNHTVRAVQFVLKTDPIRPAPAAPAAAPAPKKLNFWQKLLRLFGLYKDE